MPIKKILYIANLRLPTEKAYGIQIAKMCEAFASLKFKVSAEGGSAPGGESEKLKVGNQDSKLEKNIDLELVVPYRKNHIKDDLFTYYSIKKNFKLKRIWISDLSFSGSSNKATVFVKNVISAIMLAIYALRHKPDIIYSRDELPLYFLSFFRGNLVFEAHRFSLKRKFFYNRFKNKGLKLVVISSSLGDMFVKFGFRSTNILVAHDGVDMADFDIPISKEDARKKTGLSNNNRIVMYTGHLFQWKGGDILAGVAKLIPDATFVFIGGMEYDLRNFRQEFGNLSNVRILGHKPHKNIPAFLKAADVLVLPNSAEDKISSFTSPIKLFEYMASGRPIVASGLPSISEILNNSNSLLVRPDNVEELAEGIRHILAMPDGGAALTQKASADVKNYTWSKRAESILAFIKQ